MTIAVGQVLSTVFDTDTYRLRPKEKVSYRAVSGARVDCDECFARQQETQGRSGPRQAAKFTRTIQGVSESLKLCRVHAELWKERDGRDQGH